MLISHFYSDPHFGHAAAIEHCRRPFSSIEEMNSELERRYCQEIQDEDVVLWVGDISFMRPADTEELIRRLPGRKLLVPGNHDPSKTRCLKYGFELVADKLYLNISGYKVTVCHFPPAGTSADKRFTELRPPNPGRGEYLIHGHTHEKERMIGRRIHVGVDAWDFKPAPLYEIVKMIANANLS